MGRRCFNHSAFYQKETGLDNSFPLTSLTALASWLASQLATIAKEQAYLCLFIGQGHFGHPLDNLPFSRVKTPCFKQGKGAALKLQGASIPFTHTPA